MSREPSDVGRVELELAVERVVARHGLELDEKTVRSARLFVHRRDHCGEQLQPGCPGHPLGGRVVDHRGQGTTPGDRHVGGEHRPRFALDRTLHRVGEPGHGDHRAYTHSQAGHEEEHARL